MSTLLAAVGRGLDAVDEAFEELVAREAWTPAAGSTAALEQSADPPKANRWGDQPAHDAYKLAGLLIMAAFDHLRACALLLSANRVPTFATSAVCRACLDMVGRAASLLDPSIDAATRIQRGFNERLYSSHELIKVFRDFEQDDSAEASEIEAILASAYARSYTTTRPDKGAPFVEKQRRGSTELVDDIVKMSAGPKKLGSGSFRIQSAMLHGTAYALLKTLTPLVDPVSGNVDAVLQPRDNDIAGTVMITVCRCRPRGDDAM